MSKTYVNTHNFFVLSFSFEFNELAVNETNPDQAASKTNETATTEKWKKQNAHISFVRTYSFCLWLYLLLISCTRLIFPNQQMSQTMSMQEVYKKA